MFHHSLLPSPCIWSRHLPVTSVIPMKILKCFHSEMSLLNRFILKCLSCLICTCLFRFPLFWELNSHWSHWWLIVGVVVLPITVSVTRASVVNIAIPALFATTLPFSVSPCSFILCLSIFDFFANVFLQTTQEAALVGAKVFSLLCTFECLCKIFFVENVLWHRLHKFSFGSTDFVQPFLCRTKLVFKSVL